MSGLISITAKLFTIKLITSPYFYKFYKNELPQYLFKLIPVRSSEYSTRSMQNVPFFNTRHNFKNIYMVFPSAIMQWNNLDLNMKNSTSLNIFVNSTLKFIGPSANVFNSHNPKAIKFITRLRLVLSHLREHKFKDSFQDLPNPISNCRFDVQSS